MKDEGPSGRDFIEFGLFRVDSSFILPPPTPVTGQLWWRPPPPGNPAQAATPVWRRPSSAVAPTRLTSYPPPSVWVDCDVFRCYIVSLVVSKWRIPNPGANQHHRANTHGITDACAGAHDQGTDEGSTNARRSSLAAQEEGTFPDETDVPTVKHFPQTQIGLPSADGHPVRAGHHQQASTEGAQAAVRLSGARE